MLRIDHVVLGVADLDAAAARFWQEHGLASVAGGRHSAWGTANRIVPLGDDYLELLGVVDPDVAEGSDFGAFMREMSMRGDRWYTVAIRDDDLDGTAKRLGLRIESGERERPDGRVLRWRRALGARPEENPWLPFFIEWDVPPELHPGRSPADHAVQVNGISWVEIGGDDARIHELLAGSHLPLHLVGGQPGVQAVGLSIADGAELVLR